MKKNDFHILVDSAEFMDDLEERIGHAKNRVLVQAMTFEADDAGMRLYNAMKESSASEKTLSVDAYSQVNINDGWAHGWRYLFNPEHRREVDDTRKILRSSGEFGVRVEITNPIGFLGIRYPFRNHKKIVVVDGVAYLGGVNFSNHNFIWHDFMVRISNLEVVEKLVEDFHVTCQKANQSGVIDLGHSRLYFLDGVNSKKEYAVLFDEILTAQKSITILSPYVSDPLLSKLLKLDKGIQVNVITPKDNNKSLIKSGLLGRVRRMNINLYEYCGGMSHLKAILVDDSKLIFGSSNFDMVSYFLEQEVVLTSQDAVLIDTFKKRILNVDMLESERVDLTKVQRNLGIRFIMFLLKNSVAFLGVFHLKRTSY